MLVPRMARELGIEQVHVQIRALRLGGLDLGPLSLGPGISLQAMQVDWSIHGLVQGRIDSVRLMGLDILATHTQTGWSIAGLHLPEQSPDSTHGAQPLVLPRIDTALLDGRLTLHQQDKDTVITFWTHGTLAKAAADAQVHVDTPYGSATLNLDARLESSAPQIITCTWSALATTPLILLESEAHLAGTTRVMQTPQGWDMHATATLAQIHVALPGKQSLTLTPSTMELVAQAQEHLQAHATLALGDLALQTPSGAVEANGLLAALNATSDQENSTGTFLLSQGKARAHLNGFELEAHALRIQGELNWGKDMRVTTILDADVRARSGDIDATAKLHLPLAWPKSATTPGQLDAQVRWQKKHTATLAVRLGQKNDNVRMDGKMHIQPADIRATMQGQLHPFAPTASWTEVQVNQKLALPGNLTTIVPALHEFSGSATVQANARLHMPKGIIQIPAQITVRDVQMQHAPSGFALENGVADLDIADLMSMRSKPDQRLGFAKVRVGKVVLENADIRYQIEAPHCIFVERAALDWAGGRVGTQSFRINPGIEDYAIELYCDRIALAQVLGQLGMGQAQGGGRANGRIPVRYAKGVLTFTDAFLYSTPGEPGTLRVPGTEILTAGIPPDSPQFVQLDLAAEALKDFTYEWAKIGLQTQNQNLLITLELDGKPSNPLPFVYNKELGGFARISASSPGSVFQGIRLDVNFRLPLDQLMQYRQLLELLKNGG
ncbi:hypothetical protein MASR1M90_19930 [Desulfovibrionales bacterium]